MELDTKTNTKIELEEPYKSKWKAAYLFQVDNRKYLSFYNSDEDKYTTTYARYLMGVHLGYEVPSHLEVDHINDDKGDDRIENLQLLTPEQNKQKNGEHYRNTKQVRIPLNCTHCGIGFEMTQARYNDRTKQGITKFFCCREHYDIWKQAL